MPYDVQTSGSIPQFNWGRNYSFVGIPLDSYAASYTLGPFENRGWTGVRVKLNVSNVTTGNGAAATAVLGYGVDSITITNGGSSYEDPPTVEFSGGGGTGAAGTAVLTADAVTSVTITDPGTGYTSAPTVAFTGGGGADAAGTAVLTATAHIKSVTVDDGGSNYASAPTVVFTGGGGTGAAATATLTSNAVSSIAVDTAGSDYTSPPTVSFTGGGTHGNIKVGVYSVEGASDAEYTLLEGATANTTGAKGPYTVYPGVTVAANLAVSTHVGDGFIVRVTHSEPGGLWEYSGTIDLLV